MTFEERDLARMPEDLGTTIWRLRETVRVAKLAATHRRGQIRSLLLHEKHKVWKREFGFDRIETAAEMDEKRSCISTSPVPNPFFYRNMVIPEHPHAPEEFNLQMRMDVEGLRMEIILSQPPSSECDPSPRSAAVDTGSEEPGTPPQSPAISTGSGPEGEIFWFEASRDGLLRSNAQAWSRIIFWYNRGRSILCCKFNQKSEWTTATTPPLHKTPLARSLRDYLLASSKGWQRGQPTTTSSSIGEDFCDVKLLFSEEKYFACIMFLLVSFRLYFFVYCLSIVFFHFAAEAGMKGDMNVLDAPDA